MNKEKDAIIRIDRNILKFNSTILQLSNISNYEVTRKPRKKYPIWALILIVAGILLKEETAKYTYEYTARQSSGYARALIVLGISTFIIVALLNLFRGNYLIITMNSGTHFLFSSRSESFLFTASNEIAKRIDNEGQSEINFRYCTINSSQIGGNDNQLIGGGK